MNNILYNKILSATLIIIALFTVLSSCSYARNNLKGDMVLWYDQPAEAWLDANQIGNGIMGGVVFGKTDNAKT